MNIATISRDTVFIAGGQPSITYVERESLHIERQLARAIATPNQIVSLSGPTKSGKTVLCRHVLDKRQFVWIEGGQTKGATDVWDKICYELNYPIEVAKSIADKTSLGATIHSFIFSGTGSQILEQETSRTYRIDTMASALRHLREKRIALVIDDFHYLDDDSQREFLRNIKGSVFAGLNVILLSVVHRQFDAIKAETELTGRFISVAVPEWSKEDLSAIPNKGFKALNINCSIAIIDALADECQSSPFLMQKLCWDICFEIKVDVPPVEIARVPPDLPLRDIYVKIAKDSGLPIYERLVAGPQIRKDRLKRPLVNGGDADVYEATLLAIADTGPQSSISYNVLRNALTNILSDKIPQKHEVTSVLKQLSKISRDIGADVGVDWDDEKRTLDISDPYLRFYLRWQLRKSVTPSLAATSPFSARPL
jgi:hypothetical protein